MASQDLNSSIVISGSFKLGDTNLNPTRRISCLKIPGVLLMSANQRDTQVQCWFSPSLVVHIYIF